jgi:hypothetical protein
MGEPNFLCQERNRGASCNTAMLLLPEDKAVLCYTKDTVLLVFNTVDSHTVNII